MLHGKITRFSITFSILFMKCFSFMIMIGFHVFTFQMSFVWETQVMRRCCAGNEELVTLRVFTWYFISSFLEIQGLCTSMIGSLWPFLGDGSDCRMDCFGSYYNM